MEDKEIVQLFQMRKEGAIVETQKKYSVLIKSVAYHIIKNYEDAKECEVDTYLGLWNTIPPTKPNSFKAYMLKITRNYALKKYEYNHAKKRAIHLNISYDEITNELERSASSSANSSYDIVESEMTQCINEFLSAMKPANRKVFLLRYWYFMSVKEIMKECDMSKSQVESILFRARVQLKNLLIERRFFHE